MKKYVLSLLLAFASALVAFAQPQSIPYQAVARNASGNLLVNQLVALRLTVRDLTSGGAIVYQERDTATSNSLGLFTVKVGLGSSLSGSFGGINWGSGDKYLQVDLDPSGGSGYSTMGTSRMESVPYALYAANAGSVPSGSLTETGSSVLTISGGTNSVLGSGTSIQVAQATSSVSGYLASTDFSTFNNKAGGSGTSNYLARWTSTGAPGTLSTGEIQDNGTTVGVNASPSGSIMLSVAGGSSLNGLNATTTNSAAGSYALLANGATSLNAYLGYVGTLTNVLGGTITNPAAYISDAAGGATNGLYVSSTGTNSALVVSTSGGFAGNFMSSAVATFGVYSQVSDPASIGFQGINTAAAGTGSGDGSHGVTSQSTGFGLWGANLNTSGTGAVATGNALASVNYLVNGSGAAFNGKNYGVFGWGTNAAVGTAGGLFGNADITSGSETLVAYAAASTTMYKVIATGASSVAESRYTDKGLVTLYCPEGPQNKLQDYGTAKLVNGKVTVDIERLFAQCITFDEDNPIKIFLTPHDETKGNLYVKMLPPNRFEIVESGGYTDNMDVDYMIVAVPRGREGFRFNQEFTEENGKLVTTKSFEEATKFGDARLLEKYASVRAQMKKSTCR